MNLMLAFIVGGVAVLLVANLVNKAQRRPGSTRNRRSDNIGYVPIYGDTGTNWSSDSSSTVSSWNDSGADKADSCDDALRDTSFGDSPAEAGDDSCSSDGGDSGGGDSGDSGSSSD